MTGDLKNVDAGLFDTSITEARFGVPAVPHPPRILMLYGSVRERSYSRLATEEAARLLTAMGAEVRIFSPQACLFLMMRLTRILKSWNCASWFVGPKGWCGVPLNAMVR